MEAALEALVLLTMSWNCSLPHIDDYRPRLTEFPVTHWAVNHYANDHYRVCALGRIFACVVALVLISSCFFDKMIPKYLPTGLLIVGLLVACVCNWDASLYFGIVLILDLCRIASQDS